jgi:hypothetical protein
MLLINWTPLVFNRKEFPRDEEGKPFIPSNLIEGALKSATIYYYIKKDKEIENKVKNFLLKEGLNTDNVIKEVKSIVLNKYPVLNQIEIPEKIYLNPKKLKKSYIEIFDLKEQIDIKGFFTEIYQDEIEVNIKINNIEKIKAIAHSYAEGLAHMEKSMLKDHPLAEQFYAPLISEIKNWDIPLRVGMWTEHRYKGNLLYFWRIKEVRDVFFKNYKIDIRPRYILYLPKEKQTTGWTELKIT